jgi:hypothetical protein
MRRLFLIVPILGISLCIWSSFVASVRPTPFFVLRQVIEPVEASHQLSPAEKEQIDGAIRAVGDFHTEEVHAYAAAYYTAVTGLFGMSVYSIFLYAYSKRKCA